MAEDEDLAHQATDAEEGEGEEDFEGFRRHGCVLGEGARRSWDAWSELPDGGFRTEVECAARSQRFSTVCETHHHARTSVLHPPYDTRERTEGRLPSSARTRRTAEAVGGGPHDAYRPRVANAAQTPKETANQSRSGDHCGAAATALRGSGGLGWSSPGVG